MYYDRHGRSLSPATPATATPATATPATAATRVTLAAATTATPAAPAAPAPHASSAQLKDYLATHRTVWHTESLQTIYPEIVAYLQSRYVAARTAGRVTVRALDGAYPDLTFDHDDLRLVSEALLSREYRQALFAERIAPAIERLSA